jgi:dTDP-4-dehydrorhamnose 3,5-epimerase
MPFVSTDFPGLFIFEPVVFEDARGYFYESYNFKVFLTQGLKDDYVQDNQSRSAYGVVRGLHYQLEPYAQTKLVRALSGRILDVAVDIRKGSPTYGKYFSIELSGDNKKELYIPKGFAHGFSVLSETAEVMYKCDAFYNKESEAGLVFNDPLLGIDWKIPEKDAVVSEKDRVLPQLRDCKNNFSFEG